MEGQTLSHYKVLEKLGGGGMGVVYKALDTHLDRHVALKLLPPELTRDDDARVRFVLEAKAASALDHPNIYTIYDIDETPDGQMFIAMGYYEGETLKQRIARGPLPIEDALDIAIQVTQGLQKAHESGIVHRDIKPANLIVTRDRAVKIVDFGIAKLLGVTGPTQTGTTLGTVSYMSPEQVAGKNADDQSDVWDDRFKSGQYVAPLHQALQHLWEQTMLMGGGWVIDLDIQGFFDALDHGHLRGFLDQRVTRRRAAPRD